MRKHVRILLTLAISVLSMALLPFVAFPSESIPRQQSADVDQALEWEVSIEGFAFVPASISVAAGTIVRWTNNDMVPHTVTSSQAALFDSGTLLPGETFEYRFDTPGFFSYMCTIHPGMTGTVIVWDQVSTIFLPTVAR